MRKTENIQKNGVIGTYNRTDERGRDRFYNRVLGSGDGIKERKGQSEVKLHASKKKLLSLIEGEELPRRRALQDACCGMDTWMERAMETISSLSDLYRKHKERDKVVMEMERLESGFVKL